MSVLFIVLSISIIFIIAYLTYGKFLASKVFQINDSNTTPAIEMEDGVDYVPAPTKLLLGQHFSAIAAAGPITGPILAGVMFGWVPAILWIVIGSIFIGGIHDMGSLVASIRHKARSITEVVRENVSYHAYIIFMIFVWIALIYIIVAFTDITASSFIGTITLDSGEKVGGGAIATSSLLYIILPIFMGLMLKYTKVSLSVSTVLFIFLVGFAIWIGKYIPFDLAQFLATDNLKAHKIWDIFILAYCFVASLLPMWLLLQPRGHLGGYFLYAALLASFIGILFGGYKVEYPAFTKISGDLNSFLFPMFPVLFITIACGACSGFHSLVATGTTCKQLQKESDSKMIGYGAMLLEGLVAVISLSCVMILVKDNPLINKAPNFIYASGIGKFLELIGINAAFGISFGLMAFATFVYDTLDVSTRLGRYIIEELTGWKNKTGKICATALTAFTPLLFVMKTSLDAKGNPIPAWKVFWNVFGASNQLLAGLALIGITIWLYKTSKNKLVWIAAFIPAIWMLIMSNWALLKMIQDNWFTNGAIKLSTAPVPIAASVLIILSFMMLIETVFAVTRKI